MDVMAPTCDSRVVDVGVANRDTPPQTCNYFEKHYPWPERVTGVGFQTVDVVEKQFPRVTFVVADGCDLPFEDDHFDIGYSNAVIEHVGPRARQVRFAQEFYRVSKRGFLTTPNRFFPVETHTYLPLLHIVLSKKWFDKVMMRLGYGWVTGDALNLLSQRQFRGVLRDAGVRNYRMCVTRFCGLPLAFYVYWRKGEPEA